MCKRKILFSNLKKIKLYNQYVKDILHSFKGEKNVVLTIAIGLLHFVVFLFSWAINLNQELTILLFCSKFDWYVWALSLSCLLQILALLADTVIEFQEQAMADDEVGASFSGFLNVIVLVAARNMTLLRFELTVVAGERLGRNSRRGGGV